MKRPAWTNDPVAPTLALFFGLIVAGFAAIAVGWKVAARTDVVAFQIPALVSGGLGGLALIVIGAALANVQATRWVAAIEHAEAEAALDEMASITDDIGGSRA